MDTVCRYCGAGMTHDFADLGSMPLANDFIPTERVSLGQYSILLRAMFCEKCKLVQVIEYKMPESIFNAEYKYYSSYSSTWLKHCEDYVDMIVSKRNLNSNSRVLEIASNDGYLLQYFRKYNIEPIGIEPSESVAKVAVEKGIYTIQDFFTAELAGNLKKEGKEADLVIGNNVLAHVPDIGDFVKGLNLILKDDGVITLEFPHLLSLMKNNQFDTIYHEHFSYLSLLALNNIFSDNLLKIVDVEKLDTHGGSLRLYVCHQTANISISPSVQKVVDEEIEYGLDNPQIYKFFCKKIQKIKFETLTKLIQIKSEGQTIIGYGAAAKGNTLFNYCGIGKEFIDYIVDANPYKQNTYMPGSLIPIVDDSYIKKTKPDYVVIIPWNIKNEIMQQLQYIREWGGKFLIFIPELEEL